MFARISRRYDLLNRLMTFGQDTRWRREAVRRLRARGDARLLDLGAGSGDLAVEALRQVPNARLVAADFTPEMLAVGRRRKEGDRMAWVVADAMQLPFAGRSFAGLTAGFLLRNVADVDQALGEAHRVLEPGGCMVCLDTTPLPHNLLRPLLSFHLRWVIPALGGLIAGDARAYRYLADSTEGFLDAETLAERMRASGLVQVRLKRRMLGAIAIHWGERPKGSNGDRPTL